MFDVNHTGIIVDYQDATGKISFSNAGILDVVGIV
jgi:hypothetical protein